MVVKRKLLGSGGFKIRLRTYRSCQSQFVAFKVYIVEVESEMARPEQRAARLGVPGGIECLHSDDDDCAPGNDLTERGQWAVGIGIEDRKYIGAGSNYAVVAPDGMMFIFDQDPVVGAGPFSSSFDR